MNNIKTIIYVHGASSTPISFNYIESILPRHKRLNFSYDSCKDIEETVKDLFDFLPDEETFDMIGHSLGGVLLVGASYINKDMSSLFQKKIGKQITISSPLAGSKMASYLRWMYPKYGLFDNVSTSHPLIMTIKRIGAILPTLNIVTHGGELPLITGKNDGVLSVETQASLRNAPIKTFDLNHFEVLLSHEVVSEIQKFLW